MKLARLLLTAAAASLLISSVSAPNTTLRGRKLGKEQKIMEYGYGIRIIDRWSSIPQKPGEKRVIGSWQPDQKDINLRGDWSAYGCELKVVRFRTPGAKTGSKDEIDKEKEKREKEKRDHKIERERSKFEKKFDSRTLDEYLEAEYEGARDRARPQCGLGDDRHLQLEYFFSHVINHFQQ